MKSNLNYFVKIKFKVHKIPASNVIEFFRSAIYGLYTRVLMKTASIELALV